MKKKKNAEFKITLLKQLRFLKIKNTLGDLVLFISFLDATKILLINETILRNDKTLYSIISLTKIRRKKKKINSIQRPCGNLTLNVNQLSNFNKIF